MRFLRHNSPSPLLGHHRSTLPRIPTDDRFPQDLGDLGVQLEPCADVTNASKTRVSRFAKLRHNESPASERLRTG
jgi:hypothetical protein